MPRSQPLSQEERRRDIIAATVPLLEQSGFAVSTRQIADAAGVAEGTLFRVFATTEDLMHAAVASYMDPADLVARIEAIDPALPLRDKVAAVMAVVQESGLRVRTFMAALRGRSARAWREGRDGTAYTDRGPTYIPGPGFGPDPGCPRESHPPFVTQAVALRDAIAGALRANETELTVDLDTAAIHIMTVGLASLIMGSAFPDHTDAAPALAYVALTTRKDTA